jgi:hypothetical protein
MVRKKSTRIPTFLQSAIHLAPLWTHPLSSTEIKLVSYSAKLWTLVPKQDIEQIFVLKRLLMFSNIPLHPVLLLLLLDVHICLNF